MLLLLLSFSLDRVHCHRTELSTRPILHGLVRPLGLPDSCPYKQFFLVLCAGNDVICDTIYCPLRHIRTVLGRGLQSGICHISHCSDQIFQKTFVTGHWHRYGGRGSWYYDDYFRCKHCYRQIWVALRSPLYVGEFSGCVCLWAIICAFQEAPKETGREKETSPGVSTEENA